MYLTQSPYYISTPLYSNTSLFRQMEITPINSGFPKFLLKTIIFLLHFITSVYPYSNIFSLHFPTENTRANIFFSHENSILELLKDKFHKITKQSPTEFQFSRELKDLTLSCLIVKKFVWFFKKPSI